MRGDTIFMSQNQYLTDEERAEVILHHGYHGYDFISRRDLVDVVVIPYEQELRPENLASACSGFTAQFMRHTKGRLNGFPGLDTVRWIVITREQFIEASNKFVGETINEVYEHLLKEST